MTPSNSPPVFFPVHNSRTHVDAQGTLVIRGVAPEDAGNYSCLAANEAGMAQETVTLFYSGTGVAGPPPSTEVQGWWTQFFSGAADP